MKAVLASSGVRCWARRLRVPARVTRSAGSMDGLVHSCFAMAMPVWVSFPSRFCCVIHVIFALFGSSLCNFTRY